MGRARRASIQEVLDCFLARSAVPIRVEPDPERLRPSDIPKIVCDYGRLYACTGWRPTIAFEQSLADVSGRLACSRSDLTNEIRSRLCLQH